MPSGPLIQLKGVSKLVRSGDHAVYAIAGVDLDVYSGEYVSLEGEAGCGKAVLAEILGLQEEPTEGRYLLNGRSVLGRPLVERAQIRNREIGFVSRFPSLIEDVNVFANVEHPLRLRGIPDEERLERVIDALVRVGLVPFAAHQPSQLNDLQQLLVAVARAIAGSPSVVLVNEATCDLHTWSGHKLMELLAALNRSGQTIVQVSHDVRFPTQATRTVYLEEGRVVGESLATAYSTD